MVRYCIEPRPGLDIARNTGINSATSSIVAYVDDDVFVHLNWAHEVVSSFDDPSTMAMTGLVIAAQLETEAQQIFEKFWSFNRGYSEKTYDNSFFQITLGKGPPVWEIGAGANMAFRKKIFSEIGLFDERLDVGAAGCNGDSEMWFRILAKGFSIRYNPRAVVFHQHRETKKGLKKQLYNYMRGFATAALIQQHQIHGAGYKKILLKTLPRFYFALLIRGFPRFSSRSQTVFSEIGGLVSGVRYYLKNKKKRPY